MKSIMIIAILAYAQVATGQARAPKGADREVIAACIIAEGGGHGRAGMEAIWEVIHARASQRETTCIEEVLRRKQFSCLNGVTPTALWWKHRSHREYAWVHDNLLKWVPITSRTGTNPYNRATHYHAAKIAPYWAKGHRPCATLGGHKFYRNIK